MYGMSSIVYITIGTYLSLPCADLTQLHMLNLDAGNGYQVDSYVYSSEWSASMLAILRSKAEERAGYVL